MKLVTFHKILIGSSVGLGAVFTVWNGAMWLQSGNAVHAAVATCTVGATIALAIYLRTFMRNNP